VVRLCLLWNVSRYVLVIICCLYFYSGFFQIHNLSLIVSLMTATTDMSVRHHRRCREAEIDAEQPSQVLPLFCSLPSSAAKKVFHVHFLTGVTVDFPVLLPSSSSNSSVTLRQQLQLTIATFLGFPPPSPPNPSSSSSSFCCSLWWVSPGSRPSLTPSPDSYDVVYCVLRLQAGKGGFGSNLRSAGKRDRVKATTNFDACR
jgi:hypothetical protein